MKPFKKYLFLLYDYVLRQASSRLALPLMMLVSFLNSIFFPIPPDVMLAPMTLAKPKRGMVYAGFAVLSSVCGALVTYQIGQYAAGHPELIKMLFSPFCWFGSSPSCQVNLYNEAISAAEAWGVLMVLIAAISVLPFKAIVLTAGLVNMPMLQFFAAAVAGRFVRYGLVCGLLQFYGDRVKYWIEHHMVKTFTYGCLALLALVVLKFWLL